VPSGYPEFTFSETLITPAFQRTKNMFCSLLIFIIGFIAGEKCDSGYKNGFNPYYFYSNGDIEKNDLREALTILFL